jgi:hypothetical protein
MRLIAPLGSNHQQSNLRVDLDIRINLKLHQRTLSSHEAGIKQLIQMRGPDQHRSALGLAILEDVRYSCVSRESSYNSLMER